MYAHIAHITKKPAKVVNFVDICKQIRTKLAYSKKYSTFVPLNHPFRQQQYDADD
jgi:hypothetical protein